MSSQAHPSQNEDAFPGLQMVKDETKRILQSDAADPEQPHAKTHVHSKDVAVGLNHGIRANHNAAVMSEAISWYFGGDNIALPGFSLFFQVDAQVERNDAIFKATFLNRRGQHPSTGPTAGYSTNDFRSSETIDELAAMATSLAMNKVQYEKHGELYKVAVDQGDAVAADFISNVQKSLSYRIHAKSHYVTQLKLAQEKAAVKALDAQLPIDIQELAVAAGIESTIPNKYLVGSVTRAFALQSKGFDVSQGDPVQQLRAKAAFAKLV